MFKPTLQIALLLASACFLTALAVEDTCDQPQTDANFDKVSLLTVKTQLIMAPAVGIEVEVAADCPSWSPGNSCSSQSQECHQHWEWSSSLETTVEGNVVMCRRRPFGLPCQPNSAVRKTTKKCNSELVSTIREQCSKLAHGDFDYDYYHNSGDDYWRNGNEEWTEAKHKAGKVSLWKNSNAAKHFFGTGAACADATDSADCLVKLPSKVTASRQLTAIEEEVENLFDNLQVARSAGVNQNRDLREQELKKAESDRDKMLVRNLFLHKIRTDLDETAMDQGQFVAFKQMLDKYCK